MDKNIILLNCKLKMLFTSKLILDFLAKLKQYLAQKTEAS